VELLVVITIITMLALLSATVAFNVITAAKQARIKTEVGTLAQAIEKFKIEYGSYPPMLQDRDAVQRFVERAFPDARPGELPPSLDATQSLVYWLQGFSPDKLYPFSGSNKVKLFEFDETRLRGNLGEQKYFPPGQELPYVYFQAGYYESAQYSESGAGTLRPYKRERTASDPAGDPQPYANHDSFQIISAGLDDQYGTTPNAGLFPKGPYDNGDGAGNDNIVNFNDKNTLGDSKP